MFISTPLQPDFFGLAVSSRFETHAWSSEYYTGVPRLRSLIPTFGNKIDTLFYNIAIAPATMLTFLLSLLT
jgi:hypothetical protein